MRNSTTRLGRIVALAGLLIAGVGATDALAQGAPAALEQLLAKLAQLQASVDTLQDNLEALGAVSNVAITPAVIIESGIVDCTHVNVTNADLHVVTQLIVAGTGAVLAESGGSIATQPGTFRGVGALSPSAVSGTVYCKFTVLDGTKADIRGSLTLTPNVGGNETTSVSAAAY